MFLVNRCISLVCYPVVCAASTAAGLWSFSARLLSYSAQLPVTTLVVFLQVAETFTSSLIASLTKQPGPKTQVARCQEAIRQLQQANKAQHRQLLLLQSELDQAKLDSSKAQVKNLELTDKVESLKRRLKRQQEAAVLAAAVVSHKAAAGKSYPSEIQHQQAERPQEQQPVKGPGLSATAVLLGTERWQLHGSVALAAVAVRWWLLHQADDVQQRITMAIVWPASWLYGAMVFRCLARTPGMKFLLVCCCWFMLGCIGHDYIVGSCEL